MGILFCGDRLFLVAVGPSYPASICVMEAHRGGFDLVCRIGGR